jgi:tetratricopeptide (TPR) repeat protein
MVERGNVLLVVPRYLYSMILISLIISGRPAFSQEISKKATRQSSIEAFNAGNFEKAYRDFSDLLITFPKDPLYKYYSGVSLVKLNREPEKALNLLKQSLQGTSVAKSIPSDALFWLGRAQQMSGKFDEAISSFETYTKFAGKKVSRESGVPEFIQQCNNRQGSITRLEPVADMPVKDQVIISNPKSENDSKDQIPVVQKQIKEPVPEDYELILSEAMDYQVKSDSLYRLADNMKKDLESNTYKDKAALKASITQTENLAASFQKIADNKYGEAQAAMNKKPFAKEEVLPVIKASKPDSSAILKDKVISPGVTKIIPQDRDEVLISGNKDNVKKPVETKLPQNDSSLKAINLAEDAKSVKKISEAFSVFEVIDNQVYKPDEKISINPVIPQGLIYRIQVAVFRNLVASSYFKGITPVYGFRVAGTDKTNYYAGMFRRFDDAGQALALVRKIGFKDAFIICLFDGKAVSKEKAAVLEKEWGKKPFITEKIEISDALSDTIPPTLSFRVEVMRTMKPPKDETIEEIKKLAGKKGLDTVTLQDGTLVYLIGNFITFESAEEYSNLLVRNGYRESRVSAWLGSKEIPVDTAKKLFEKVE